MFGVLRPQSPDQERLPSPPQPPPNSLAPLPTSDFPSRESLLSTTKEWAADQGFAIVIARSRFNRIWLKCDRGGSYENRRNITPEQRKRKRGESRLLGCPFKMVASVRKDGSWHVETEIPDHNHEPSGDLSAHPTLRRMTNEQLQKVSDMCDNGNTPSETIEELRRLWPDIKVLTRDIYNARKKHKTIQEQAMAEAAKPPAPALPDPNGLIPGPDDRGRWAWVPDGEEVTNKKGKRRRRTTAPATQTALDPQLATPNQPTAAGQSLSTGHQQFIDELRSGIDSMPGQAQGSNYTPDTAWMSNAQSRAGMYNGSPSNPRSQSQTQLNGGNASYATPRTGSNQASSNGSSDQKSQNAEALVSRIERMEQEQKDTKGMLAAILGAVKGMNGTPQQEATPG